MIETRQRMADRTPERTRSHGFAVLRASSKRLLIVDSWSFQDGKSAAEILIRSACSDQLRRDCNSQNFRLAVPVDPRRAFFRAGSPLLSWTSSYEQLSQLVASMRTLASALLYLTRTRCGGP